MGITKTCATFTVLTVLTNEYRVPQLNTQNTQNNVSKTLSFTSECSGAIGKDYTCVSIPPLVDALVDRDANQKKIRNRTKINKFSHDKLKKKKKKKKKIFPKKKKKKKKKKKS